LAANEGKSDRFIAEKAGVSHPTVRKAREASTGNKFPVGGAASGTAAPAKRVGKDGKGLA
jgi:hypothetical protein